jgi:peptide subunit release factor 1 (eRF1)
MENKSFTVKLKCLFCDGPLESDKEKEYSSGDMVKCNNCEELNDYDALIDIAFDEGKTIAIDSAKNEIKKMLKKTFRK